MDVRNQVEFGRVETPPPPHNKEAVNDYIKTFYLQALYSLDLKKAENFDLSFLVLQQCALLQSADSPALGLLNRAHS
jgi:hypothetical protein